MNFVRRQFLQKIVTGDGSIMDQGIQGERNRILAALVLELEEIKERLPGQHTQEQVVGALMYLENLKPILERMAIPQSSDARARVGVDKEGRG
jgi:hypothetical protein